MSLKNTLKSRLRILSVLLLGLSAISLLAPWYRWADMLTSFVWQYALLNTFCFAGLWLLRERAWAVLPLLSLLPQLYLLSPFLLPKPAVTGYSDTVHIVHFNINVANTQTKNILKWLDQQNPAADIVVLFEVSTQQAPLLMALQQRYPHHLVRQQNDPFGIALFHRLPKQSLSLLYPGGNDRAAIYLQAHTAKQNIPFQLLAIHPPPPVSELLWRQRNRELGKVPALLAQTPSLATIVLGDLNIGSASPFFRKLLASTGLEDAQAGFGLQNTWPDPFGPWLGIALDKTLVSSNIQVIKREIGPSLGSDHRPVWVSLGFPP